MLKLAYLLIIHKNLEQVIRLVDRLSAPDTIFLIHVDKKVSDEFYSTALEKLGKRADCHLIERISVYWGSWGVTQAIVNGILHLGQLDFDPDFLFILSGQDYPIKSHDEIQAYLADHQGQQLMEIFPLPYKGWGRYDGMRRFESFHFWIKGKHLVYPPFSVRQHPTPLMKTVQRLFPHKKRTIPGDLAPYGGSSSVTLAGNAFAYIYDLLRQPLGEQLLRFFKRTNISDELFLQTLIGNSPLKDTIIGHSLVSIDWSAGGPHPKIFTQDDFDTLIHTPDRLFARKFDIQVDARILDMLDQHCEPSVPDPSTQFVIAD